MRKTYWFYGVGVPAVAGLLFMVALTGTQAWNGESDYVSKFSKHPDADYQTLTAKYNDLVGGLRRKRDAAELLDAYVEIEVWRGAAMKAMGRESKRDPVRARDYEQLATMFGMLTNDYLNASGDALRTVGSTDQKAYGELIADHHRKMSSLKAPEKPRDWSVFLFWLAAYIAVRTAFAIPHYVLRHLAFKNRLGPLVLDGAFYKACVAFEWFVWRYPVEMTPVEQFRRAYRFATLVLGTCLTWGGAFAKVAFAQGGDGSESRRTQKREWTVSGTSLAWNKFVGPNGGEFHQGGVLQSNVTASHRSGVFADLWTSEPLTLRKARPNYGREEDYTLGYAGVGLKTNFRLSLSVFNVFPMLSMPRGDLIQFAFRAERGLRLAKGHSASAFFWARKVMPLVDGSPKGGLFLHYGVSHEWRATRRLTVASSAEAVRDHSGAFGFNRGWIAGSAAALSVRIGKGFSIIAPAFKMTKPITDTRDGRKFEHAVGFGIAFAH